MMYEVKGVLMVTHRTDGSWRSVKVNKPHIYWCKQRKALMVHILTSERLAYSAQKVIGNYNLAKLYVRSARPLSERIKCASNSDT